MDNIIDGLSMNIEQTNLDKLRSVFPECVSEGKLDIDKLLSLCGEYIDNDFEKYRFEWKGKAECLRLAQKRSSGTLRHCPAESVNWDTTQNLYIEGDNLEVLKLLQSAYYRKVKMIYIDPPYNTGNDFVYTDDFADPLARYKEVTQQTTKSNPETMGRYHTNWLNMMYPRLRLAANLLRDDGLIFISIDDNELTNLTRLCDEVFGEENHMITLIWHRRQMADSRNQDKASTDHEYVLVYKKSVGTLTGREIDKSKYSNPDNDPRGPWFSADLTGLADKEHRPNLHYDVINPKTGISYPPNPTRGWSCSRETMQKLIEEERILWPSKPTGRPRQKKFLSDIGQQDTSFSSMLQVGFTTEGTKVLQELFEGKVFSYPKPVSIVQTLVEQGSGDEDIVLDFFGGSSTTAHAVMLQNLKDHKNRKFILVQLPEKTGLEDYPNICEIGKERIRRAGKKLTETKNGQLSMDGENAPLDIGFKVFKLDSSNMKLWDSTPIDEANADELTERMNQMVRRIKPERSDLDMVYEVMLKLGVPLTFPVQRLDINGKPVYEVGEDCLLLICLAEFVEPEDVEAMADYAPAKMIMSRDCFTTDTAMANAHYILRDRQIELKLV